MSDLRRRVAERAERIANQPLCLPKTLTRGVALPTKRVQRCAKEIDHRACPHRFPMLGDAGCGQCAQCVCRAFAGPRVSKPL